MRLMLILLVAMTCAQTGCSTSSRPHHVGPVNHPVFISLHDPADAAALIDACDTLLPAIPGVTAYACGRPLDTGRENITLNFDVGLYLAFDSVKSYERYLAHPNHQKLVDEWMERIASMRIYDVMDE